LVKVWRGRADDGWGFDPPCASDKFPVEVHVFTPQLVLETVVSAAQGDDLVFAAEPYRRRDFCVHQRTISITIAEDVVDKDVRCCATIVLVVALSSLIRLRP